MGKFKRLNLAEAEEHFPLLNAEARKALKGGCDGCSEWIVMYPGLPIYTEDEYLRLSDAGEWTGGLVCGFGYMLPEAVVYANMGYCGRHQEYYQDGHCYSCYLKDHYCDFHQVYFCYDCNQPGGTMGGGETGGDGNTGGGDAGSDGGAGSSVTIPSGSNNLPERINFENGRSFDCFLSWFKYFGYSDGHGVSSPINLNEIITQEEALNNGFKTKGPGMLLIRDYKLKDGGLVSVVIGDINNAGASDMLEHNNIYRIESSQQSFEGPPYAINLVNNDGYTVIRLNCYHDKATYDYLMDEVYK